MGSADITFESRLQIDVVYVGESTKHGPWSMEQVHQNLDQVHSPNANMADHSVSAGTSCMKVRLVRPRCFVLTMLPLKSLASWTV